MKFGIVLPSYVYGGYREIWAQNGFRALEDTRCPSTTPKLLLLIKPSLFKYPSGTTFGCFDLEVEENPPAEGTEQTLAYGTQRLLDTTDVTHIVWMGDDADFHPRWLVELEALINRRPDSRAWSVYHSAYKDVHATVRTEASDVLVRSLCGHGMTFAREEWEAWGIRWAERLRWDSPSGNTLDLHHVHARSGERWCTYRSWVEHTGRRGVNCHPGIPERGLYFAKE